MQGYEIQLGMINLGYGLLTKLLTPTLIATAKTAPIGSVRVVWTATYGVHSITQIDLDTFIKNDAKPGLYKYSAAKAGAYLQSVEFARRFKGEGVLSVALNPGNLDTRLGRDLNPLVVFLLRTFLTYPPLYGAYTQIFAGLSPMVTLETSGGWSEFFSNESTLLKKLVELITVDSCSLGRIYGYSTRSTCSE